MGLENFKSKDIGKEAIEARLEKTDYGWVHKHETDEFGYGYSHSSNYNYADKEEQLRKIQEMLYGDDTVDQIKKYKVMTEIPYLRELIEEMNYSLGKVEINFNYNLDTLKQNIIKLVNMYQWLLVDYGFNALISAPKDESISEYVSIFNKNHEIIKNLMTKYNIDSSEIAQPNQIKSSDIEVKVNNSNNRVTNTNPYSDLVEYLKQQQNSFMVLNRTDNSLASNMMETQTNQSIQNYEKTLQQNGLSLSTKLPSYNEITLLESNYILINRLMAKYNIDMSEIIQSNQTESHDIHQSEIDVPINNSNSHLIEDMQHQKNLLNLLNSKNDKAFMGKIFINDIERQSVIFTIRQYEQLLKQQGLSLATQSSYTKVIELLQRNQMLVDSLMQKYSKGNSLIYESNKYHNSSTAQNFASHESPKVESSSDSQYNFNKYESSQYSNSTFYQNLMSHEPDEIENNFKK